MARSRKLTRRLVWYDLTGTRQQTLLPGPFGSQESLAAKARFELELTASPTRSPVESAGIRVAELLLAYLDHAERYYVDPDGGESSEVREIKLSIRPVRELYGDTLAADFGPLKLKAARSKMISLGWCRTLVNRRVDRVRRAFKWAAGEELVPVAVLEGLRAVVGLRRGRGEAHEGKPFLPVDPSVVAATLPYLNRHLRTMVELQRLTGMRPGEVCRMRLAEVDRTGPMWLYRPSRHKTRHHGRERVIVIGPQAQGLILGFLTGSVVDPSGPLFSPYRAREERFATMRSARKSKVPPSQLNRRKSEPKRLPAMVYTPHTYTHAIRQAAKKASVAHWHPNQLRHTYATQVRKEFGLEAAQVALGHSRADVTQMYAERNDALAFKVALKIG